MNQDPKNKGNHPWKGATTGAILVGSAMALLARGRDRAKEQLQKLISSKRWFVATICILALCVLATSFLLAGQLHPYLQNKKYQVDVDLFSENGFAVDDGSGRQLFSTESDTKMFHAAYRGASGEGYTVQSADGDDVIAPGTEGTYNIRVRNTRDVEVYYSLVIGGYLSDKDSGLPIPILVRMKGASGEYVIGAENLWVPLEELRDVTDAGSLKADQSRVYTLEWKWPFESGNDAYDTLLGNGGGKVEDSLLADEDVEFFLSVETLSMLPVDQRSPFQATFERLFPFLLLLMLILLSAAIYIVIRYRRSDRRAHE